MIGMNTYQSISPLFFSGHIHRHKLFKAECTLIVDIKRTNNRVPSPPIRSFHIVQIILHFCCGLGSDLRYVFSYCRAILANRGQSQMQYRDLRARKYERQLSGNGLLSMEECEMPVKDFGVYLKMCTNLAHPICGRIASQEEKYIAVCGSRVQRILQWQR